MRMYLDFETYSEANLSVVGAYNYATHPSTEILVTGYILEDTNGKLISKGVYLGFPDVVYDTITKQAEDNYELIIIGHNVMFEYYILKYVSGVCDKVNIDISNRDRLKSPLFLCTMEMANYMSLPSSLGVLSETDKHAVH